MFMCVIDKQAKELGAVIYQDMAYPKQRFDTWPKDEHAAGRHNNVFSRHYFNNVGIEIAYVIPDLELGLSVLPGGRHWPERIFEGTKL